MSAANQNTDNAANAIVRDGFIAPDGREITLWRWPQAAQRPTLHWAHATGFHGRLYRPLLDQLSDTCNVMAWDMRGHGASAQAGDISQFRGWQSYYDDLCALLDASDSPMWLAGHSIGATASIMAAARRPDKVLGLILAEPVIVDRWQGFQLWLAKFLGRAASFSLAAGAARRRETFGSRIEAVENYRGRGAFKTWPDEWLEAYVEHGFVNHDDEVRLACAREWEGVTFAHTEHNPWPGIRLLNCPIVALGAENASTFAEKSRQQFRRLQPSSEVKTLTGTTHFLPMERPEETHTAIRGLMRC